VRCNPDINERIYSLKMPKEGVQDVCAFFPLDARCSKAAICDEVAIQLDSEPEPEPELGPRSGWEGNKEKDEKTERDASFSLRFKNPLDRESARDSRASNLTENMLPR
jgi:hypothetical protein